VSDDASVIMLVLSGLGVVLALGFYNIHAAIMLLVKATREQTEILRWK
jgi:hypothetical protein